MRTLLYTLILAIVFPSCFVIGMLLLEHVLALASLPTEVYVLAWVAGCICSLSTGIAHSLSGKLSDIRTYELDPNDARAYYNRGNSYRAKGEYERAIADYTRALELDPNDARAYGTRGNSYADKGEYERAIADYTRALELNPSDAWAYNNRGLAYKVSHEKEAARRDFQRAAELGDEDAKRELA
jgi:tetratricopeptide (TPR) repeat protein